MQHFSNNPSDQNQAEIDNEAEYEPGDYRQIYHPGITRSSLMTQFDAKNSPKDQLYPLRMELMSLAKKGNVWKSPSIEALSHSSIQNMPDSITVSIQQADVPPSTISAASNGFNVFPLRLSILHAAFMLALLGVVLTPLPCLAMLLLDNLVRHNPTLAYLLAISAFADAFVVYGLKTGKPRLLVPALIIAAFYVAILKIGLTVIVAADYKGIKTDSALCVVIVGHGYNALKLCIFWMAWKKMEKIGKKGQKKAPQGTTVAFHNGGGTALEEEGGEGDKKSKANGTQGQQTKSAGDGVLTNNVAEQQIHSIE